MLEKISVSSAEDSHALQQIYRWETLLKLQVTQSKASWGFFVSVSTEVAIVQPFKFCWIECRDGIVRWERTSGVLKNNCGNHLSFLSVEVYYSTNSIMFPFTCGF